MAFEKIDDSDYIIDIEGPQKDMGFASTVDIIKLEKDTKIDFNNVAKTVSFQTTDENRFKAEDIKELIKDGIKYRKIKEAEELKNQ